MVKTILQGGPLQRGQITAVFPTLDSTRIEHAQLLKAALEKYREARGKYPATFSGNDIADLHGELVDGGFIKAIPVDPY